MTRRGRRSPGHAAGTTSPIQGRNRRLWIDTSEATSTAADTLHVQLLSSSGTVLATLATYSSLNANYQYVQKSFDVSAFAGQTIMVRFVGTETDAGGGTTDFVIDDTALNQAP